MTQFRNVQIKPGVSGQVLKTDATASVVWTGLTETVVIAMSASDLTTDLTTGTTKAALWTITDGACL